MDGRKDSALALHEPGRDGCRVPLPGYVSPRPNRTFWRSARRSCSCSRSGWRCRIFCGRYASRFTKATNRPALVKEAKGIDTVITRRHRRSRGHPNWIRAAQPSGRMRVITPLWGRDRGALLQRLSRCGSNVVFSCVKTRWLAADWVGRELDPSGSPASVPSAPARVDLCGSCLERRRGRRTPMRIYSCPVKPRGNAQRCCRRRLTRSQQILPCTT